MTKYLVTFKDEEGFQTELMTIKQIADLYGFADVNGTTDHRVYRLGANVEPTRLELSTEWIRGIGTVAQVLEPNGTLIEQWEIMEH